MSRNVHIPWIKITLDSGVSLSWRGNPSRPDYFTSLSNKRTVEQAALIDLNITYCPKIGEDCNLIEKAIVESPFCTIQYGDTYGSRTVSSRVYKGLIYSYAVQFNEGYLSYSFKMVSTSVVYNFDKCESITIPEEGKSWVSVPAAGITVEQETFTTARSISDQIKRIVNKYMSDHYIYDETTSKSAIGSALIFSTNPVKIPSGLSPIQTIIKLVQAIPAYDDYTRVLEIDDAINDSGKGSIRVVKYDESIHTSELSFEWGTKDGTVIRWTPDYNGSVAIFRNHSATSLAGTSLFNPTTGRSITLTYDKASAVAGELIGTDPTNTVYKALSSMNEFTKMADYPYCASLTVLGEDRLVSPASTKFKVTPLVMGVAHHSAGIYAAKSITDTVNGSEGFTTTYELYRLSDQGKSTSNGQDKKTGVFYNGSLVSYEEFDEFEGLL